MEAVVIKCKLKKNHLFSDDLLVSFFLIVKFSIYLIVPDREDAQDGSEWGEGEPIVDWALQ